MLAMTGATDSLSTNKAVVRRHFEEVLNQGRLEVIDSIYTEDYVLDAPIQSDGRSAAQGRTRGRQGLKERVTLFRTAFPDIHFSLEAVVAEDDRVAVQYRFHGTQQGQFVGLAPTGNRIDIGGMLIARLVDSQIDSAWSVFDSGQLMRQARGELLI
jgi:predicted ester cyclase